MNPAHRIAGRAGHAHGSTWTIAFLAIGLLCSYVAASASTVADFLAATVLKAGNEPVDLPYRYLVPPGYDPAQQYPLIVFLHGSGERGSDNAAQLANNANGALQLVSGHNQAEFPAFMLAPQASSAGSWDETTLGQTARAIAALASVYSIDPDRIYVTGLSLGGAGTFLFVSLYPDLFAAAVPMSAYLSGDSTRMSGVPMWVFHAADDLTVPVSRDDMAVAYIRATGGQVVYSRYAIGGHVIWPAAYATPYLMPWMTAQRRHQPAAGTPLVKIASPATKLPPLQVQNTLNVSGTATFPDNTSFQVYWTYTPSNFMSLADASGTASASGTANWSVSPASSDGSATYFMALARGPTWGMGSVGGGVTTVNDLVWVIPNSAVLTPPMIAVASPSASGSWTTTEASVDLAGSFATGPGGALVQQVTWENDRGGQGVATRSPANSTWTILGVALQPGANEITIRAMNTASVWGSTKLVVQSTPFSAPAIMVQPQSAIVASGASAMFTVIATGVEPLSYQWEKNGQPINGATASTLTWSTVQSSDAGNYAVRIAGAGGTTVSALAALWVTDAPISSGRLANLSVRALAGAGDQTLMAGFIVSGGGNLPVLIRGWGPALKASPFNIADALANPLLRLFEKTAIVAENDDWGGGSAAIAAARAVGAYPFDLASKDAALIASVPPGANSAHVVVPVGPAGIGMAEVYDASGAAGGDVSPRLSNLSARAQVGTGDRVLIGGIVIGGTGPVTVLIRAVGPTLSQFGVGGLLANPLLELHSTDAVLRTNDDWSDASNAADVAGLDSKIGFSLPAGSRDAAILATLTPGAYTAVVSGVKNTTGVALLEIYEIR